MHRTRHRTLALVLAAAAGLALGGCDAAERSPIEPLGGDEPHVAGQSTLFFAQTEQLRTAMEALYRGPVERADDGCLRIQLSEGPTVVWPKGFGLEEGPGGELRVVDAAGEPVAALGDRFRLVGGIVTTLDEGMGLSEAGIQRALESCPGRYWIVGEVLD